MQFNPLRALRLRKMLKIKKSSKWRVIFASIKANRNRAKNLRRKGASSSALKIELETQKLGDSLKQERKWKNLINLNNTTPIVMYKVY